MVTFIDDDDIELKTCPFCGSTAGLYVSYEGRYTVGATTVASELSSQKTNRTRLSCGITERR